MGNKYTAFCVNKKNRKETVMIISNNKIEAKERVLKNHPTYDVISVFAEEDLKIIKGK